MNYLPSFRRLDFMSICTALCVLLFPMLSSAGNLLVASTNLAHDMQKVRALASASKDLEKYWSGDSAGPDTAYITQILRPEALSFELNVPNDPQLYGQQAGQTIPVALVVLYPTTLANPYPDYDLPGTDFSLPRMHPGSGPMYLPAEKKFPLLLFSHGLYMHPLEPRILNLVDQGYIVAALFHGDGRFPFPLPLDLHNIQLFSLRPLALRASIDFLLNHPQLGAIVDPARIGGLGISLGGSSLLALMGAKVVGPDFLSTRHTAVDPRVSAGLGIVPFMGQGLWTPIFGWDARGAEEVHAPFMAVSASNDSIADLDMVKRTLGFKPGGFYLVQLDEEEHQLSEQAVSTAFGWGLAFLEAHLKGNPAAQAVLKSGAHLDGPVQNTLIKSRPVPGSYPDEVFQLAEVLLPETFEPGPETQNLLGISYRYYPQRQVTLAAYANDLYFVDRSGIELLGPVMFWWSGLQEHAASIGNSGQEIQFPAPQD